MVVDNDLSSQTTTSNRFTSWSTNQLDAPCDLLRRQWPVYWALLILLVCSFPLTARSIWVGLESEYQYQPPTTLPKADAVLVLSGMLRGFETQDGYVTEWGDPDRFLVGLQLVKLG